MWGSALGARGVSLLFASGDSGYTSDQKYPASSPYVTSVGGVTLGAIFQLDHISVDGETTGGFSSLDANAMPSGKANYQAEAVRHHSAQSGTSSYELGASHGCGSSAASGCHLRSEWPSSSSYSS